MAPVAGLTELLGVRPGLAVAVVARALSATISRRSVRPPVSGRDVLVSAPLTWFGVHVGYFCSSWATTPETTGVDIEVPPAWKYAPSRMQAGQSLVKALPGARVEMMWAPGAITSGLAKPSWVVPMLPQLVEVSSAVPLVARSSAPPTVITYGSLPGAYRTASVAVPRLPAAATTTMPFSQADSTAASSGSVLYDCGVPPSRERLMTRML